MTGEQEWKNVMYDLDGIRAATCNLYVCFDAMMNTDGGEGIKQFIRMIHDDITSLHDDVVRKIEGRCEIRGLSVSGLRASEILENLHYGIG